MHHWADISTELDYVARGENVRVKDLKSELIVRIRLYQNSVGRSAKSRYGRDIPVSILRNHSASSKQIATGGTNMSRIPQSPHTRPILFSTRPLPGILRRSNELSEVIRRDKMPLTDGVLFSMYSRETLVRRSNSVDKLGRVEIP